MNNEEEFDDFKPASETAAYVNDDVKLVFQKEFNEVEAFKEDSIDMLLMMSDDPKDALTEMYTDYIQQVGDANQISLCSYKHKIGNKGTAAIDGWSFNGDEDQTSIDLFLSIYVDPEESLNISKTDLDSHFNWLQRFFEQSETGSVFKTIKDNKTDLYQVAQLIHETPKIDRIRLFIMTNAIMPYNYVKENIDLDETTTCEFHVWDAKRIMQQDRILSGRQSIKVDFDGDYNCTLPCIKMPDVSDKVTCYLCIIPGMVLAQVYHKYHQQILEMNVRTFLQFKGASNKGIRNTLIGHIATAKEIKKGITDTDPEPDMFFAYNNGISATASAVELNEEKNAIVSISDWQIVNGGQTTAAISAVMGMKDIDVKELSKVYVAMKISVVKQKDNLPIVVPKISRFANTQSAVKKSDFDINEEFLMELEQQSRENWVMNTQGKPVSKWFFERTRGQYLDKANKQTGAIAERQFYAEYPKEQMFDKALLSKFMMAWEQNPASVCRGGENNYGIFLERMKKASLHFDKTRYRRTIAKLILYKAIDAYYGKDGLALPGYKSNMVAYTLALLSHLSGKTLDLDTIWKEQCVIGQTTYNEMTVDIYTVYAILANGGAHVTYKVKVPYKDVNGKQKNRYEPRQFSDSDLNNLRATLLYQVLLYVKKIEPLIYKTLITDVNMGENINEWTKKPLCWETLKANFDKEASQYVIPKNLCAAVTDSDPEVSEAQQKYIDQANEISADSWYNLNKWAKEQDGLLSPKETAFVGSVGFYIQKGRSLSYKQAKWALDIYKKAIDLGWEE